jgi:hypothetical protein
MRSTYFPTRRQISEEFQMDEREKKHQKKRRGKDREEGMGKG